tara:strand:- start:23 stop:193 length:171 start_codon:yes stop_codon:yes gene_type:complete
MIFALKRIDGEEDSHTKIRFKTYDDAYDYLEKIFGQACCSDADYEKNIHYNIIEKN